MKPSGWVFMAVSWSGIILLCAYCFRQMFEQHRRRKK